MEEEATTISFGSSVGHVAMVKLSSRYDPRGIETVSECVGIIGEKYVSPVGRQTKMYIEMHHTLLFLRHSP